MSYTVGANIVRPFNSKMFYVTLSYVVTLNLYIFASLPCVKGDVLQMQNRGIVTVDCVL